jgi:hypothetical protein
MPFYYFIEHCSNESSIREPSAIQTSFCLSLMGLDCYPRLQDGHAYVNSRLIGVEPRNLIRIAAL